MITEQEILALADWSKPKEIQTKNGPRILRKAKVTEAFSAVYKTQKAELKTLGAGFGKTQDGEWELAWWQELSTETLSDRKQSIEDSRATSADIALPVPAGLDYMPFQKAGIQYALARKNVLIGDEMGLGKTIQAIGIINADPTITSVVIVCPKSLKLNWKRELEKWLTRPLLIGVVNGSWSAADIVILNYEATGKFAEQLKSRVWGAVIVDEAHYIKSPKAQRSKNVKSIPCQRKIRLTGTPIVNRPIELYNIVEDLHDGFGSFFSFAKRYTNAQHNGFGWDFSGAANLDELQKRLRETVMVRRLKIDVLTELPRKIRQIVEVEADTTDAKRAVKSEQTHESASEERLSSLRAAVELSKAESDEAYKSAVAKLREASQVDFTEMAKLRHDTAVAKVPSVITHVSNALEDNDNKIIIAGHHHDVINALMEGLAEYNPVKLTGENSEQERIASVDAFQNNPAVRVFIGSITAAGVGITLTASSHVVFAELDWVPGNVSQMEDRAHRIGQTETVLVQHIVLSDSLDARMANAIISKQNVIDNALDVNHPERTSPVYEPKNKSASHDVEVSEIEKIAETMSDEQIKDIHAKLRIIAGLDGDFANDSNGVGFNKIDTLIGHSLAECKSLSPKQAALGLKLVTKYRRQLT